MFKCILWGTGYAFKEYINCVRYHEQCKNIEVLGVTSNNSVFQQFLGYKYIPKSELSFIDYDIVIVMAQKKVYHEILSEAVAMGIAEDKMISCEILAKPNCNLEKYLEIRKNPPTIFANNCWGGLTYHALNLQFASPLINMFLHDDDYIKLLQKPKYYMQQPLVVKEYVWNDILNFNFPVCLCDDIVLYFNHYDSFEKAEMCWEKRKQRINWDNLFVMMHTASEDVAREFSRLPYEKKICFVPFEADEKSVYQLDFRDKGEIGELPLWKIVNSMAIGNLLYYDDIELIHSGTIKKLCE